MPNFNIERTLLKSTGRKDLQDAVDWIAEGHVTQKGAASRSILRALILLKPETAELDASKTKAVRYLARQLSESGLDTSAQLFDASQLRDLTDYRQVLDLLARCSPTRTLAGITADAVMRS